MRNTAGTTKALSATVTAVLVALVAALFATTATPSAASAAAVCTGATGTVVKDGSNVYANGKVTCTAPFYLQVETRVDGQTIYAQRFGPFNPSTTGRNGSPVPLAPGVLYQSVVTVLNGTGAVLGTVTSPNTRFLAPTRANLASFLLNSSKVTKTGRLVSSDLTSASQNHTSSAGAYLGQTLLQNLVFLTFKHTYTITALESGGTGHSAGSLHYNGNAVDLGTIDGVTTTGRDAKSVLVINDLKNRLPSGSGFGQSNCGTTPSLPTGITTFADTCNHLHWQLPRGTA